MMIGVHGVLIAPMTHHDDRKRGSRIFTKKAQPGTMAKHDGSVTRPSRTPSFESADGVASSIRVPVWTAQASGRGQFPLPSRYAADRRPLRMDVI